MSTPSEKIEEHYDKHLDFFADNWSCAFDEMVYFRQMIEQARFYVSRHAGSPQADEWLEKYQELVNTENDN